MTVIAGMSWYQILWFFMLYSFIGWVVEVAFHAVALGKVVNRGFLNGPICPVYGCGMLLVLAAGGQAERLTALSGAGFRMSGESWMDILLLFLGGVILTTSVELLAGWALDVLFHTRWWDYRDRPLNFRGYICLEFSLIWGLGVVFVVRALHPLIVRSSPAALPERIGWYILLVLYLTFVADIIVSVLVVIGLNKRLAEIDQMQRSLRSLSDRMSETIGSTTITATRKIQETEVQAALGKAELRDAVTEKLGEARDLLQRYDPRDAMGEKLGEARGILQRYDPRDAMGEKLGEARDLLQRYDPRDAMGEKLGEARDLLQRMDPRDAAAGKLTELRAELKERMDAAGRKIRHTRYFGTGRLLRAFPQMTSRDYKDLLDKLKASANERLDRWNEELRSGSPDEKDK